MMIRRSTKSVSKALRVSVLNNPFSSSANDDIPPELTQKDWLTPPRIHRLFASIRDTAAILPSLDLYSARRDYKPNAAFFALLLRRVPVASPDAAAIFSRAIAPPYPCRLSDEFFRAALVALGPARAFNVVLNMHRRRVVPSTETFNVALGLLVDAGMFEAAHRLFAAAAGRRLPVRADTKSFNVMVRGMCEFGRLDVALDIAKQTPSPDSETREILVRHLSLAGRVDEALGIMGPEEEARLGAVGAMIGRLARAGRLDEAMAMLRRQGPEGEVEPYRDVFDGLVGARRFVEAREVASDAVEAGVGPGRKALGQLIVGLCGEKDDRMDDVRWALEEIRSQGYVPGARVWRAVVERLVGVVCFSSFVDEVLAA